MRIFVLSKFLGNHKLVKLSTENIICAKRGAGWQLLELTTDNLERLDHLDIFETISQIPTDYSIAGESS